MGACYLSRKESSTVSADGCLRSVYFVAYLFTRLNIIRFRKMKLCIKENFASKVSMIEYLGESVVELFTLLQQTYLKNYEVACRFCDALSSLFTFSMLPVKTVRRRRVKFYRHIDLKLVSRANYLIYYGIFYQVDIILWGYKRIYLFCVPSGVEQFCRLSLFSLINSRS